MECRACHRIKSLRRGQARPEGILLVTGKMWHPGQISLWGRAPLCTASLTRLNKAYNRGHPLGQFWAAWGPRWQLAWAGARGSLRSWTPWVQVTTIYHRRLEAKLWKEAREASRLSRWRRGLRFHQLETMQTCSRAGRLPGLSTISNMTPKGLRSSNFRWVRAKDSLRNPTSRRSKPFHPHTSTIFYRRLTTTGRSV